MKQEIFKRATLSPEGLYRYSLERTWDMDRVQVNFIMLNPSTADAENDDPTIRKIMRFAESWGHGGIVVTNLFAWRSSSPNELGRLGESAIGRENNAWIAGVAERSSVIICAWGNDGLIRGRGAEVLAGLRKNGDGRKLHYLHLNNNGEPKHPLYCKGNLEPIPYG